MALNRIENTVWFQYVDHILVHIVNMMICKDILLSQKFSSVSINLIM